MIVLGELHRPTFFEKLVVPQIFASVWLRELGYTTDAETWRISPEYLLAVE